MIEETPPQNRKTESPAAARSYCPKRRALRSTSSGKSQSQGTHLRGI